MEKMRTHNDDPWIESRDFKPILINEVEISEPLPNLAPLNEHSGQVYQQALILVRLHSCPIGTLELEFTTNEITSEQLAAQIWSMFCKKINQHLEQDGLLTESGLSPMGINSDNQPKCLADRLELLKTAPLIDIVLATRDRVHSLATAFDSLVALDYPNYEIILVDNAPRSNETHDFFIQNQERLSRKNIGLRYVREDVPGLAVAHNRGLELVKGSIVAFTDDDVIVDKYWLAEILNGFRSAENVGCVTGLVIPSELETPAQVLFEEFGGFTKGFDQQIYDLGIHRSPSSLFPYAAGRFGTGANMAFKTDTLLKAGGFDSALGIGTPSLGADDMAAFFQVIMQGCQLVYHPSALVYHQHRRTYGELRKQMYGYGTGLTAFLMKCMFDNPSYFTDIVSKIPAGIKYAFAANSTKNQRKSSKYPHELENIERKGMLYGPIAYLVSRWRYRNAKKFFLEKEWSNNPSLSQNYPTSRLND